MGKFKQFLESVGYYSDDQLDKQLKGKEVLTFDYNDEAIMDFGKTTKVYITKDKKFFHIAKPGKDPVVMKSIEDKIKKYNLKLNENEINEGFISKIKNKIKNFSSEDIEIGRHIHNDKDTNTWMPKNVYEVIEYNKEDDLIKLKDVDSNKIKEYSFKDFWKQKWSNLDYLGEESGSGLKVYRFWQEVLKTKEYVIPKGKKIKIITDNLGYTKFMKNTKVKDVKMLSFISAEARTDDTDDLIEFNPFDIVKN